MPSMFRRRLPTALRLPYLSALAAVVFFALLLGWFGAAAPSSPRAGAERAAASATENIAEESWLRLRWQSLLPGMMK